VDVFDERGIRWGFIELAPGSKVIGCGARVCSSSAAATAIVQACHIISH
jgi:hypothetical protein